MADEQVLPCPFCGDRLGEILIREGSTSRWRQLVGCCADGPEVRYNIVGTKTDAEADADARKRAINAWNERPHVEHLMLCESGRFVLKKDKLYIFTVDPTCPKCIELDACYGEKDG